MKQPHDRVLVAPAVTVALAVLAALAWSVQGTALSPSSPDTRTGSDDRGARRIVADGHGEFYYTNDHYESFRRIVR